MTIPDPSPDEPYRPQLSLRVGVTGHRKAAHLGPDPEAVRAQIDWLLQELRDAVADIARSPAAQGVYCRGADGAVPFALECLSALAERADRWVARAAIERGYRLTAVLPFDREIYAEDFRHADPAQSAASLAEFEELLAAARGGVVELDGGRLTLHPAAWSTEALSYEAGGRFIIRNCDVLIAIWDGEPAAGAGGTAQIVEAALASGVAVWWIDPIHPGAARFVDSLAALRTASRDALPTPEEAATAGARLRSHVGALLLPPSPIARERESGPDWYRRLDRAVTALIGPVDQDGSPLARLLAERHQLSGRLDGVFDWIRDRLVALGGPIETAPHDAATPALGSAAAEHYRRAFAFPDYMATVYARRYRSAFVIVFLLGALAGICAVGAAYFQGLKLPFIAIELASLVLILLCVRWYRRGTWHDRWIEYRLLAEALRLQCHLVLLGRAIPAARIAQVAKQSGKHRAWVGWWVSAIVRGGPIAAARYDAAYLGRVHSFIAHGLLTGRDGQIAYFRGNHVRYGRFAGYLSALAFALFLLTVVLVGVKAAFHWHHGIVTDVIGFLAGAIPTLMAAGFAIRAHAELELLEKNGERIAEELERLAQSFQPPVIPTPLASDGMAEHLTEIARVILSDVEDWALLFDLKVVETA